MKKQHSQTNLIFCHKLIKAFADSLVKAFIPLIILKNSGSMMLVMLYLTSYYALCCLLNVALKKFLQKYGIVAMILHTVPLIALQFLLTLSPNWWLCLIVALLASLAQVLYSVPLNLLFAFTDKRVNVAKFQISTNVGKLIFILLSGYVIGSEFKNSILILAIVGTVLYLSSIVPIFYGYKLLKNSYEKLAEKKQPEYDRTSYKYFNIFHMCFALFQSVLDVIVPLYLYTENLTFEAVAIVMALIEVCKIGANLLAKQLVKTKHALLSCMTSASCMIAGTVIMMTVKVPVVLYICSCVIAVSFPLLFVPMFRLFVKKVTRDKNQFDGMSYRDVYIMLGKDAMFLPYFVFPNLITSFVVGIAATVGVGVCCTKIIKHKK